MTLARAIQLFMPGKPQIWYLDLLCGKNDHEAVARAGEGGHKEINRTNYDMQRAEEALQNDCVRRQIELIRFRNTHPAFDPEAEITLESEGSRLWIRWARGEDRAELKADLETMDFTVLG